MFETENYYENYDNLKCNSMDLRDLLFEECSFKNCTFQEADFSNSRFINCTFEGCNLSIVKVSRCTFKSLRLLNSKAYGVNWSESLENNYSIPAPPEFSETTLEASVFQDMNLDGIIMINCSAVNVDFQGASLIEGDLRDTDFQGSRFNSTNIAKADLRGAFNYSIDINHNNVKKAQFSLPEAVSLLKHLDIILK